MMRQVFGVGAVCSLLLGALPGPAPAEDTPGPSELPVDRIEEIVRDYLLREPEVIYEALQELQRRQQVAAAERQKAAIAANEALLFDDPETPFGGDADAEVTLVEFFDYRCTYCRRVVGAMQALLQDEAGLKIVFKDLPVLGEDSVRAARAALASREQDGYLPFHFALMQAKDLSHAGIMAVASDVGLDAERLAQDMQDPAIQRAIDANYALADELGIEGTPAFVIGDQLIPGAVGEAQLRQLIDQQRAG
jgi:protein-disulfide isomerase